MIKVVGVRFKKTGKIYYFDPDQLKIKAGCNVIVETARGIEFGEVVMGSKEIADEEIVTPLKKVIRIATQEDKEHELENTQKEKEAFCSCCEKIKKHGLEMKLIDVEFTFDNNKILFYFTAEGRIDFRELVKDLAAVFKTRIELRQVGVRDESKMVGGLGICGRSMCCCSFLSEFEPVSIKMAKEQGLSLNPIKISGTCGRLMCCLKYEQHAYEELIKKLPKVGAVVSTPQGQGTVVEVNVLTETIRVRLDVQDEADIRTFKAAELKVLKDAKHDESIDEETEELKSLED